MIITVDKKVATDLLGKAKTGNDILSVLDMIVDTFTGAPVPDSEPTPTKQPTLEEIEF